MISRSSQAHTKPNEPPPSGDPAPGRRIPFPATCGPDARPLQGQKPIRHTVELHAEPMSRGAGRCPYNRPMSTPRKRLESEVTAALKAGEKDRLSTLRLLLSEVKNEAIRTGEEVNEESFLKLVRKAIKQRKESIAQFREGGRDELADREEREAEILSAYLPPAVDEIELTEAIRSFVAERALAGPAGIGPVMKEMMTRYAGRADGSVIRQIAQQILNEGE